MSISKRKGLGNTVVNMLLDDIQFQRGRYYYFLGGVEPWSGIGNETSGDLPDVEAISQSDLEGREVRSEMVFAKLISPNDVSLAVDKHVWVSGTVYDHWDHTKDMKGKPFYVLTTNNNVYKCLDNGSLYGETTNPSTVEPNIISFYTFKTADGYLWKYMYTVAAYAATRFSSVNYMPVKKALSDSFYNNGAVDAAVVVTEGSGYVDALQTTIAVAVTTTGSGATAVLVVNELGTITSVEINDGGTGYTKGVNISISETDGAGAKLTAVVEGGEITGVDVDDGGVGYSVSDTVNFTVGGAELIPVINQEDGSIYQVKIINPGIGYSSAPTLTVVGAGGAGSGKYGNPNAIISAIEHEGSIVIVNIEDPGIGYPFDNATTITVQGDGENATFTPVILDGKVIDVIVNNPGEGYTDILLTVQSDEGDGATVKGVITQSDYTSNQSVVEQAAVDGAIYMIEITNGGVDYSINTTVTVEGNGTGCTAEPVVSNGEIKRINITNYGTGYTWANIVIADPVVDDNPDISEDEKAAAYAILPPIGGHGKDATIELLCDTLAINTPLKGDLKDLIDQDYRTFGILKNPRTNLSGSRFLGQSAILAYKMSTASTSGLVKDSVYLLDNNRFRVIDFVVNSFVYLTPLSKLNIAPIGLLTNEANSDITLLTTGILESYDFNKYSGSLLYVSTENPFEFSAEQSITIKTFLKF